MSPSSQQSSSCWCAGRLAVVLIKNHTRPGVEHITGLYAIVFSLVQFYSLWFGAVLTYNLLIINAAQKVFGVAEF